MPWSTSDRRATLPADWPVIRRAILERDAYACQSCGRRATDVDHKGDRYDHSHANLQSLCTFCHKAKTAAEGHDAMNRQRAKLRHPREQSPGLR